MSGVRILLLGGRGAVGRVTSAELRRLGHDVTIAGRSMPEASIDLTSSTGFASLGRHAADHDVVINASGVEDSRMLAATAGAVFVDVSATAAYLRELRRAAAPTQRVVLGVGLVPGLSTILIRSLASAWGADVDLAIVLGAGEVHGAAAVAWTASLAGASVFDPPEGGDVMNFVEHRRFPSALGWRAHRRADFPDHELIGRVGDLRVRSYLATGDRLTTNVLGLAGRIPSLAALIRRAPHVGDARWSLLAVDRSTGNAVAATGGGQSEATGLLTAWTALAAHAQAQGVVTTADLLTIDDVRREARRRLRVTDAMPLARQFAVD